MNDIDVPMDGFDVSEIGVSDISGDKLRILRKVKSDQRCHSYHAVTVSDCPVACVIRRMNNQQPTVSAELFVQAANHRAIQRGDSIRLVPAIRCDQDQRALVALRRADWRFTHLCHL